ncbi:hypothetical protein K4A81_03300 [Bacillus velezensis]|uniref:hypothetical protein n=1 Tax=Bacillus amyloliquefaciens group TaxID=1938374 RepID=UPI0003979120|nr:MULTISPECIES: hypothetical protein [Bacillus amyloliquefaciens group]ERH51132.1 hypothetical protein O205_14880 [Bacillus amyloliquefaciens EGD-AQ14]POI17749.1 hypothetical protein C2145_17230 [Bacillus velezensis]QZY42170.1 hypothetical protein K4A81_03300 [Bacillus velezensis]WRT06156.1 hypothetical protein VO177_00590 [Bacillus velezensis]
MGKPGKSYFVRTFHIIGFLLTSSFLLLLVLVTFMMINAFLHAETSLLLNEYTKFLYKVVDVISKLLEWMNAVSFLLLLILLVPEIVTRISKDSLGNWFKSFWVSYRLRRFLVRQTDHEGEGFLKIQQHNRSIRKSVIDIRNKKITYIVKLPNDMQVQKLILEAKEILREEISSRFPDYTFSNFERYKHWLRIEGTKMR